MRQDRPFIYSGCFVYGYDEKKKGYRLVGMK